MKTSRVCAVVVVTLAMFAADRASADIPATGGTAVLNTYVKVMVDGNTRGPNELGKLTGAGTMDSSFAALALRAGLPIGASEPLVATDKQLLATAYTRSANTKNGNNSYLQGGVAFATLTAQGVVPGATIDFPNLNGDRTFMRPIVGACAVAGQPTKALVMAASEDNGVNNNPQPVAYLVNADTGVRMDIKNSTRGSQDKPTNLIKTAQNQGINVPNAGNQRGAHTLVQVTDAAGVPTCTWIVGMQYNNDAQEAYSVTVQPDNTIKMNWLVRYSDTAQHCRPDVKMLPGAKSFYIAAVEANNQPADIGFRVTKANVATGKAELTNIAVRSQPGKNLYVSEPRLDVMAKPGGGDVLAVTYGWSTKVRDNNNGNGHAGGKKIDNAVLIGTNDLKVIGAPSLGVGSYGRHGGGYVTPYGPKGEPALAVISGSSTGTGAGFLQIYPLKADGTLGVKDPAKVYQVSPFSDVANVQARGKRNPNNQARGFINGQGGVKNPGFTTDPAAAATSFMPEVSSFSFSAVTGYSGPDALAKGQKNSIWLALVPATWQEGLQTIPGKATETPGTEANGLGPAPRTTSAGTDPTGEATNSPGGAENDVVPDGADDATHPSKTRGFDDASTDSGCSVSTHSSSSSPFGLIGLAIAGVLVAIRRKRGEA